MMGSIALITLIFIHLQELEDPSQTQLACDELLTKDLNEDPIIKWSDVDRFYILDVNPYVKLLLKLIILVLAEENLMVNLYSIG